MENELMKLWQVPRSSWLVSGQDEPARAALLQAELARRRGLRVIVAAEEAVPAAVQAARRAGFKRLRTLPAAGEGYFPAFTPGRATERESRLLELLRVQGWEEAEVGKANAYLDFILGLDETVHRAPPRLDVKLLELYRGVFGVERALWKLGLDEDTRRVYLQAYAECASAGPRIENFLRGLEASLHLDAPRSASLSRCRPGEVVLIAVPDTMNPRQRAVLFQLLVWDIRDTGGLVALDVIEGPQKWGGELASLLEQVVSRASVTLYCSDLFARDEALVKRIKGLFGNAIYLYHSEMASCKAISAEFGEVAVVHPVYTQDRDRRLRSSRMLDKLMGSDRVDHYAFPAPVHEPLFRPEEINGLEHGGCLVKTREDAFMTEVCLNIWNGGVP